MNRIGLVTTDPAGLRGPEPDTGTLAEALRRDGHDAKVVIWHDAAVDWAGFDLVVIRTPWDYSVRYAEFMAWLDRVAAVTRVLNAPELIRWNIDKRYLDDFAAAGVPVVPTAFCATAASAEAALREHGTGRVVVKPSVSAGSRDTGLFTAGDPAAAELARRIVAAGKTAMVQPALDAVTEAGEHGLFFFNGDYAGAFHKGPILLPGGAYVGGTYTSTITRGAPDEDEIALGRRAVAAVADIAVARGFGPDAKLPLYARIDIAAGTVIEVEVSEPGYALDVLPGTVDIFVRAVRDRLR
ncbi:ATP-grasp domain-containing protein [Symbioplanes lichenis]|uniref:ATP-grasp domain-containing protein n=1 Tax=Symbioplanes lichenis TaxID=1629072 RepID=UPI002738875C|nr:hypothetical protein [Actinoplanes lichenis]